MEPPASVVYYSITRYLFTGHKHAIAKLAALSFNNSQWDRVEGSVFGLGNSTTWNVPKISIWRNTFIAVVWAVMILRPYMEGS